MTEVGGSRPSSRRSPTKPVLPEKWLFTRYRHVYAGKGGWLSTRTSMTPPINYNSPNHYLDVYKKELILRLSKDIFEGNRQTLGKNTVSPNKASGTYHPQHTDRLATGFCHSGQPEASEVTQPPTQNAHTQSEARTFEPVPSESGAGFAGSQEDPVNNTEHEKDNCFITSLKRAHTIIGTIHPADNYGNGNQISEAEQSKQAESSVNGCVPVTEINLTAGSVSSVNGDVLTEHTHQTGDSRHKYQSAGTTHEVCAEKTPQISEIDDKRTGHSCEIHERSRPETSGQHSESVPLGSRIQQEIIPQGTEIHQEKSPQKGGTDGEKPADNRGIPPHRAHIPSELELRVLRERSFVKTSRMAGGGDGRLSRSGRHLVTRMSQEALLAISETRREMAQVSVESPTSSQPSDNRETTAEHTNVPSRMFKLKEQKLEENSQDLLTSPACKKHSTEATPISPDLKLMSVMNKQRKKDSIRYSFNMSRMNNTPSTIRRFSKSGSGLRIHTNNLLKTSGNKLPYLNSRSTEELHKVTTPVYREKKDTSAPLIFDTLNNFKKLTKEKSFQITPPGWDVRYKDLCGRKGQEALDDTPEEVKVKAIEKCSDWLTKYM